jgi:hypothetical protein
LRAALAAISAGYVRPSLAVDGAELGLRWSPAPRPIVRLILVERNAETRDLKVEPATPQDAVEWAADLLREQRERLASLGGAAWRTALERVAEGERGILERSFHDLPTERLAIPASWDAPTSIEATARRLGIDGSPRPASPQG